MFEKEELALMHKALSELVIKGSDSHMVASVLNKIIGVHEQQEKPIKAKAEK